MKKRLISILTVFIFMLNFIPVVGAATLQEVYYSNLRIALKSMSSTSTKITFNSDYLVKLYQGSVETKVNVSNGTSYSLAVENNKIKYLDNQYDYIEIISLNENGTLSLQTGNITRKYMGDFKIVISSSKILPINIIDVERYLTGAVGYEIWPSSPIEALKAQTLAARTYALNNYKGTSSQFDLNDDETSQVYKGVYEGDYKTNILKAVNDTKGEVLTYNNSLIAAYFSASNGGYTEQSGNVWSTNLPYLDTKEDSFDTSYTWTRSYAAQEIETRMLSNGKLPNGHKFSKIDLTSIKKFQSGRLETMNLEVYKTLTKDELLKVLATAENIVDITLNQNIYQFKLNSGNVIEKQITEINSELKKQNIIFSQDTALRLDLASIKKAQDGSIEGINLYYSKALNKTDVRTFLNIIGDSKNLLSSLYTISFSQSNNIYTFSGKGYGHGVGMSQHGAKNRANAGQTYRDILSFYYPSTVIEKLSTYINGISAVRTTVNVNEKITFNVVSTSQGNKLFKYVVVKNGTTVFVQDYLATSSFTYQPFVEGDYILKVYAKDSRAGDYEDYKEIGFKAIASQVSRGDGSITINAYRIYGDNRIKTSVAVSQTGWDNSDYAVIARADDFPDALSAGPLAKKYDAPILLTSKDKLDTNIENELLRLKVKNVFIIGSEAAVSKSIEDKIKSYGIKTERIGGNDRFETSIEIAKKIGSNSEVFVATGINYPDALSISSIAGIKGAPIILTPSSKPSEKVLQYLQTVNPTKIYVIGGVTVVPTEVLSGFEDRIERLSGKDRYETNLEIAKKFNQLITTSKVFVATGQNFPDALATSSLASKNNSMILLVSGNPNTSVLEYINSKYTNSTIKYILGGENVVSTKSITQLFK